MLQVIKRLLLQIIENIDTGNSNITDKEAENLIAALKQYTDKEQRLSKYQACRYLNVSRATFDNYIKDGKLPKGSKTAGWKELSWNKKDLDRYISTTRK